MFGGTFNPIHSEHKKLIKHLSSLEYLDKVLVMPTHIPPHKTADFLADDIHRLNMCRIAVGNTEKVSVSDFEINRKGKSYTFYTVEALKKEYPRDELFVVCGGDMAITLASWHRFDELKKMCTFLVVDRPGTDKQKLREYIDALILNGAKIRYTECVTQDVSSTNIRENIEHSKFIPKEVYAYIKEHGLYETK